MKVLENIKNLNGEEFLFEIADKDSISVVEGGYIITPDGNFINIADDESHENVFNCYLNKYLCNNTFIKYELFKSILALTEYNHIIYFGVKTDDVTNIYSKNGNSNGFGIFIFPNDIESLPNRAKEACIKLIDTNKSIFGDYEKIELQFNRIKCTGKMEKSLVLSLLSQEKSK